jgi:hypothetical protein
MQGMLAFCRGAPRMMPSEVLRVGPKIHFLRPYRAVLCVEIPIPLGNRVRIKQSVRPLSLSDIGYHTEYLVAFNGTVNNRVCHMDSLRTQ